MMKLYGKLKKFDQKLYEKYDQPAREKLKAVLGDFVQDFPDDDKKQDMVINSASCRYKYLELQVCCNWTGDKYPYETVYIYERKASYADDTLFILFNKDMTKGYLFDVKSVKGTKPRRLKKYSRYFVYDIPWEKCLLIYVNNLDKETFEFY